MIQPNEEVKQLTSSIGKPPQAVQTDSKLDTSIRKKKEGVKDSIENYEEKMDRDELK